MAVVGEDLEMVEYFIKRGAEIKVPPYVALIPRFAAYVMCAFEIGANANEILHLLLRSGANFCFGMKDEDHPVEMAVLHCVAIDKNPSMLLLLLGSETADVHFQLREFPSNVLMKNDNPTEGHFSIDRGRTSSDMHTLLRKGSDSDSGTGPAGLGRIVSEVGSVADGNPLVPGNAISSGVNGDYRQFASSKASNPSLSEDYRKGATPLHVAVKAGLVNKVKLLLEHGADPHIKNADGYRAMDLFSD